MRILPALAVLTILAGLSCGELTGSYSIIVDGNGSAVVTLVASGQGTVNVPLPLDVKTPAVRDALYVKAQNGMEVSVDAAGQSTVLYKTMLLTSHDGDAWKFRLDLPKFESATIVLYVPEDVEVQGTEPTAAVTHVGLSKSIVWSVKPSENRYVTADYVIPKPHTTKPGEEPLLGAAVIIVAVLFLTATAILLVLGRRKGDE